MTSKSPPSRLTLSQESHVELKALTSKDWSVPTFSVDQNRLAAGAKPKWISILIGSPFSLVIDFSLAHLGQRLPSTLPLPLLLSIATATPLSTYRSTLPTPSLSMGFGPSHQKGKGIIILFKSVRLLWNGTKFCGPTVYAPPAKAIIPYWRVGHLWVITH